LAFDFDTDGTRIDQKNTDRVIARPRRHQDTLRQMRRGNADFGAAHEPRVVALNRGGAGTERIVAARFRQSSRQNHIAPGYFRQQSLAQLGRAELSDGERSENERRKNRQRGHECAHLLEQRKEREKVVTTAPLVLGNGGTQQTCRGELIPQGP
jgi:hypothetical protein